MENDPEIPTELDPPLEPLEFVCDICIETNLTDNVNIQSCVVCEESYCIHHASVIDSTHCAECLHDVNVLFETIRRTEIHESKSGVVSTPRSRTARQIKLGGLHWLFAQRKIPVLSDAELAVAIEYHYATHNLLIIEREQRRNKQMHRNAGVKFNQPASTLGTVITTEIKKSRKVQVSKPDKAAQQMAAAFEALKAAGFTAADIAKIASKK